MIYVDKNCYIADLTTTLVCYVIEARIYALHGILLSLGVGNNNTHLGYLVIL